MWMTIISFIGGPVIKGLIDEVGRLLHPKELERTTSYWMLLPLWNLLPVWALWVLPTAVGAPIVAWAIRRRTGRRHMRGTATPGA